VEHSPEMLTYFHNPEEPLGPLTPAGIGAPPDRPGAPVVTHAETAIGADE
jgi:hypothetical protein